MRVQPGPGPGTGSGSGEELIDLGLLWHLGFTARVVVNREVEMGSEGGLDLVSRISKGEGTGERVYLECGINSRVTTGVVVNREVGMNSGVEISQQVV